ncbi:anhydro-N-acetylmuramic acid kinase [Rhodobacterales bacterium HTCC2150]|nr:anhydro-N-acetylmuramic acid kinase [Rhodobacterales bacterium HTCC2150] [Rhodobacteraceae bacterium HTCC2150]
MEEAKPEWVLGTMSGTSLDGVDAAMVLTDGIEVFEFGRNAYRRFTARERSYLKQGLGKWPGERGIRQISELVDRAHMEVCADFEHYSLVGYHGQTLAHEPSDRGTHQAGDGQALAAALGRPVVWDFRSADVAMGGEGAPLAPVFHQALARYIEVQEPVVFLNLGGVGNITWIDPMAHDPDGPGALLAFDTGPANAPINDLMQKRRGEEFDKDGRVANEGEVREEALAGFFRDPYFLKVPPKSLDRNAFDYLGSSVALLSDSDAAMTLAAAAATAVVSGLSHCPRPPEQIFVTGGGRKNPVLMAMLAEACPCPVMPVESVGLDGDFLEAQAFAYLAMRIKRGLPTSFPTTTGVPTAIGGGVLSRPG